MVDCNMKFHFESVQRKVVYIAADQLSIIVVFLKKHGAGCLRKILVRRGESAGGRQCLCAEHKFILVGDPYTYRGPTPRGGSFLACLER